ncbi:MAG: hypothetical protein ACRD1Z_14110, partial [Vicinamibacteria bacterium]
MGDSIRRHERERESGWGDPAAETKSLSGDESFLLGVVAVERNLITPEQFQECMREQEEAQARGERVPLDEILKCKRWITTD